MDHEDSYGDYGDDGDGDDQSVIEQYVGTRYEYLPPDLEAELNRQEQQEQQEAGSVGLEQNPELKKDFKNAYHKLVGRVANDER